MILGVAAGDVLGVLGLAVGLGAILLFVVVWAIQVVRSRRDAAAAAESRRLDSRDGPIP